MLNDFGPPSMDFDISLLTFLQQLKEDPLC
ncbi:Uncharacterised protein [Atlantibacter hermannii]|nr:Uncharacterised protein [Atlantibacter hermannii]